MTTRVPDEDFLQDITCCICSCMYSSKDPPVTLPCGHTFGKQCVANLIRTAERGGPAKVCPVCRHELPAQELPVTVALLNLTESLNLRRTERDEELLNEQFGCVDCSEAFSQIELAICTCFAQNTELGADLLGRPTNSLICQNCKERNHGNHYTHDFPIAAELQDRVKRLRKAIVLPTVTEPAWEAAGEAAVDNGRPSSRASTPMIDYSAGLTTPHYSPDYSPEYDPSPPPTRQAPQPAAPLQPHASATLPHAQQPYFGYPTMDPRFYRNPAVHNGSNAHSNMNVAAVPGQTEGANVIHQQNYQQYLASLANQSGHPHTSNMNQVMAQHPMFNRNQTAPAPMPPTAQQHPEPAHQSQPKPSHHREVSHSETRRSGRSRRSESRERVDRRDQRRHNDRSPRPNRRHHDNRDSERSRRMSNGNGRSNGRSRSRDYRRH